MASKPTISDVAARAGVSKGAVSFALNGRAGVSADTRARILRAASDLGFTPNATARALSTRRSGTLGLVMCRPRETARSAPGIPPFIAGIESALAPSGHLLSVLLVDNEDAEAQAYRELARAGRVDGVFVTDLRADDPRPALLEELGVAAVTLNRPTVPSAAPAVCVDEESAIRDAVEHLVRLGHQAIGHVGGPRRYLRAARRRDVWADVLCKFSLPTGLYEEADVSATGGAEATRSMFDAARPPTAILYASDLMAMTGLAVAQQRGLRIPEDLSVVGFDDGETSVHLRAPLCTVRTDAFGWGRAAATALQACIAGEDIGDIRLPAAQFVVRGSIGPAPGPPRHQPRPAADS
jgi:LacI family transcriptional regulator, repressor for deo operon, udp, cdd, tsx, nupC, and nupG